MSGMVVPAGVGARQFHVTSRFGEGSEDAVIWLTGEIANPAECWKCGGTRYMIAWDTLPKKHQRWHVKQWGKHIIGRVSICECSGHFIE